MTESYKRQREAGMPKTAKGMRMKPWCSCYPGERPPRFLRPFLLLLLRERGGHGYELIDRMREMGLEYSIQEAGYVYRTLRSMEVEGLITSKWDTANAGPAKRVYEITPQGVSMLHEWAHTLENIKVSLEEFLRRYKELLEKKGDVV